MADNAPPHPQLEGIKSVSFPGSLEEMQFRGHSQMKVPLDFYSPEPRENKLLSEGIKLMSLCDSSQEDIIQKLTTTCLSDRTRSKCWVRPISASVLVRTSLVWVWVKREH